MKAIILAAGLGTRLRPFTLTTPKPLLPIGNKPLLAYHLDSLRAHHVSSVLINTHHLPEQIEKFVEEYQAAHSNLSITTIFEPELLGSAGTVKANEAFFRDVNDFFIIYGDNFTNIDYLKLLAHHRTKGGLMTIASYEEAHPEQKGVIESDANGRIKRFVEKPKPGETTSTRANAGIYVAERGLFSFLQALSNESPDFGNHVFPFLLEQGAPLFAYPMTEHILDIGTPESYTKAQQSLTDRP